MFLEYLHIFLRFPNSSLFCWGLSFGKLSKQIYEFANAWYFRDPFPYSFRFPFIVVHLITQLAVVEGPDFMSNISMTFGVLIHNFRAISLISSLQVFTTTQKSKFDFYLISLISLILDFLMRGSYFFFANCETYMMLIYWQLTNYLIMQFYSSCDLFIYYTLTQLSGPLISILTLSVSLGFFNVDKLHQYQLRLSVAELCVTGLDYLTYLISFLHIKI